MQFNFTAILGFFTGILVSLIDVKTKSDLFLS